MVKEKENHLCLLTHDPNSLQLFVIVIGKYDDLMTRSMTSGPTLFQLTLNPKEKEGRRMCQ